MTTRLSTKFKLLLSVIMTADDLRNFFEAKFGSVLDAVVIGSPSGDTIQSRGFGFVTFKHTESVAAAVEAHYINLHGKKVSKNPGVVRFQKQLINW